MQQMHSDGGGEFINKDLDKFLKGKGVKQTVSTPRTSEHNGVTEGNHLHCIVLIDSF
jgi:transposase InsO family protein